MEQLTGNQEYYSTRYNKYGIYAIVCILISTIIQNYFGYARDANSTFKLIIAGFCWTSIFFSCLNAKDRDKFPIFGRILLWILSCSIIWSGLKSLIWGEVVAGDMFSVLFGNMYTLLDLVGIFFIWSIQNGSELRMLKKAAFILIGVSVVLLIFNYSVTIDSYFLTFICTFAPIFIPYISLRQRIILLSGMLLAMFCYYGGGRQAAVILLFAFISICSIFFSSKKVTLLTSLFICILPFFLLYFSLKYGSIFEFLQDEVTVDSRLEIETEDVNTDTRTFLWAEMSYDFENQDTFTQLTGKGAIAYYRSFFFQTNHRLGIEVPVLQWILQAGYLYFVVFTILVLYAIIRLYRYGNNQLCDIASILIAGYYCNCFVSNLVGCNLMHLGVWGMIGIAFSKTIMNLNDDELYCEINNIEYEREGHHKDDNEE